jgi:hypothetical protein
LTKNPSRNKIFEILLFKKELAFLFSKKNEKFKTILKKGMQVL